MACEEQKLLAEFIKEVHLSLRKSFIKHGSEKAWNEHCQNKEILKKYAKCMDKLAQTHWEASCENESSLATSRIKWTADFCNKYFIGKLYLDYTNKEATVCTKIGITPDIVESFSYPVKMIDVGSCYNPFKIYDFIDVLAIDLYPANNSVYQCDFLNVPIELDTHIKDDTVTQLEKASFDVVAFCFLLEYIPSSELRVLACKKAYSLLKPGGLLIISTPDSKHVGANSKLMKCWRYTLAIIGFNRIVYEKFKHMHCMVFRKAFFKDTAVRWASIYKEPYMEYSINIPQDIKNEIEAIKSETYSASEPITSVDNFRELPYNDSIE